MARATLVDLGFAAIDGPVSRGDFAVVMTFATSPGLERLEAGAVRARAHYPRSAERLQGKTWVPEGAADPIVPLRAKDAGEARARAQNFLAPPLDLRLGVQRQALVELADGTAQLVTQFHHAASDGMSWLLWLRAQLGGPLAPAELVLKRHPRPARRSRFAFPRPAASVATRADSASTGTRRWSACAFASGPRRAGVFTYNDLLCAVLLETLAGWNRERGAREEVGLWLPVNVRERVDQGFGNGTGRIRVYAREGQGAVAQAASVREQVAWSKEHGEWAVPAWASALTALPASWLPGLIRRQARDPAVDMATTLFTHVERVSEFMGPQAMHGVTGIEVVGHLLPAHAMVVAAVAVGATTHLTFTWDAGRFSDEEAKAFEARFEQVRLRAFAEAHGA